MSIHPVDLVSALELAEEIEASFIEQNFLQVFAGDDEQTRRTLTVLASGTQEHLIHVRALLARYRSEETSWRVYRV